MLFLWSCVGTKYWLDFFWDLFKRILEINNNPATWGKIGKKVAELLATFFKLSGEHLITLLSSCIKYFFSKKTLMKCDFYEDFVIIQFEFGNLEFGHEN